MDNKNIQADNTKLRLGTTLQMGKYRIDKYLASGGFGNTYLATNLNFDEQVAIKEFFMKDVNQRVGDSTTVSLSNVTQMPIFKEQMEKFKKEAQRMRKLRNENIVGVSDLFDENGTTYYVMDYIDGLSLRDMVKQRGKLVEQEVIGYLNQTLNALEVVHNKGIFHLDLKPANLMVDKTGHLRVIDFGASKQQKSDGGATSRSAICYSPGYAPIEQKDQEFENFGPWTDLYALGATLYNVLTGDTPPSTSKISDFGEKAFQFPSSVSQKMRNLIFWMMKGRRFDRPQSVADVRKFMNDNPKPQSEPILEDDNDDPGTILNISEPEPKRNPEPKHEPQPEPEAPIPPIPEYEDNNNDDNYLKKWKYIAITAIVIILGTWVVLSKFNSQANDYSDADPLDSMSVVYKNDVLGEYTYEGPTNDNYEPEGIGFAKFYGEDGLTEDGRTYKGPISNGVFTGDSAVYTFANGDVFIGTFKDNWFEKGKLTLASSGEYYIGTFSNGNPLIGTWYSKDGKKLQSVGESSIPQQKSKKTSKNDVRKESNKNNGNNIIDKKNTGKESSKSGSQITSSLPSQKSSQTNNSLQKKVENENSGNWGEEKNNNELEQKSEEK